MGILKQLFGGGGDGPFVPRQTLPTDGWAAVPGIGRLSLVWPWYQQDDPEPLVDGHDRRLGITPALELRAPRSDREATLIIWSTSGGGGVVTPEWGVSVARLHGARIEQNVPLALGGAMGRMVRLSDGADTTWRLVVPRHETTVSSQVTVPAGHADGYWPQVESMLATWDWDD